MASLNIKTIEAALKQVEIEMRWHLQQRYPFRENGGVRDRKYYHDSEVLAERRDSYLNRLINQRYGKPAKTLAIEIIRLSEELYDRQLRRLNG